jgi:hypothetical protein
MSNVIPLRPVKVIPVCSFCGKPKAPRRKMLEKGAIKICEECIDAAVIILELEGISVDAKTE